MAWSVYMQKKFHLNSIASFSLMYSLTVMPTEDSVSVLWVYYMEGSNLMSKDKLNSFTRMLCCYRFYVSDCNLVRELWKAKNLLYNKIWHLFGSTKQHAGVTRATAWCLTAVHTGTYFWTEDTLSCHRKNSKGVNWSDLNSKNIHFITLLAAVYIFQKWRRKIEIISNKQNDI